MHAVRLWFPIARYWDRRRKKSNFSRAGCAGRTAIARLALDPATPPPSFDIIQNARKSRIIPRYNPSNLSNQRYNSLHACTARTTNLCPGLECKYDGNYRVGRSPSRSALSWEKFRALNSGSGRVRFRRHCRCLCRRAVLLAASLPVYQCLQPEDWSGKK